MYSMYSGDQNESSYNTAQSFDPAHEALHSTMAFDYNNTQGSADMSVEIGRGIKRDAREDDISQSDLLTYEDQDERWQVTQTPPLGAGRETSLRMCDRALRTVSYTHLTLPTIYSV